MRTLDGCIGEGLRKKERTIKKLVDEDEVLADAVLIQLAAEIGAKDENELAEEAEDQRAVDVLLCDSEQVDVSRPYVQKGRPVEVGDGRTDLLRVDHLQPKRVRYPSTANF